MQVQRSELRGSKFKIMLKFAENAYLSLLEKEREEKVELEVSIPEIIS